ncbi:MAG: hypothetical protein A2148_12275 [Chloroflexi bacterium RBG_16_68_14]|nr:MAG: hypothetical protein A2148_12275 [Chloroflexi bacterium RBG_16_68_14]
MSWRLVATALIIASLGLAGCGDGEESSRRLTPEVTESATSEATPLGSPHAATPEGSTPGSSGERATEESEEAAERATEEAEEAAEEATEEAEEDAEEATEEAEEDEERTPVPPLD